MFRKLTVLALTLMLLMGVGCLVQTIVPISQSYAEMTSASGEVTLSPAELAKEIKDKDAITPLAQIIEEVESKTGGSVISLRLSRLAVPEMAYRMVILQKNPASLTLVVVHAKTGEILLSQELNNYPIVPPTAKRIQQ